MSTAQAEQTPKTALADQSDLVRKAWVEQLESYGVPVNGPVKGCDVTPQRAYAAGSALAQIHQLGRKFPLVINNPNAPKALLPILEELAQTATEEQHSLIHTLQTRLAKKQDEPPFEIPRGMGHGAYAPAYVSFEENRLAAITHWTHACGDTWLYDLAVALNNWGFDKDGIYRASWFHSFLAGYESSRTLSTNERRLFNHELRRATLTSATLALYKHFKTGADGWVKAFKILEVHLSKLELADYAH